jgi:cell division septation protein DedD
LKHRARYTGWPVVAAIALAAACDSQGRVADANGPEQAEGLQLVAGTALDQRAILVIPREGGIAEFRSISRPAEVVANGRTDLPASVEAHSLGRHVVLREPDGSVHRYDPQREVLTRQGQVEEGARWSGDRSRGVYFHPQTGAVLLISEAGSHTFEADGSVQWAAPLDAESVLALTDGPGGASLRVLGDGAIEVPAIQARVSAPGLLTAWGRQGVFAGVEGSLQLVDLSSGELAETVDLPAPVTAFAASPSAHRIYVAAGADGRLFALNPNTSDRTAMGRVEARVDELRTSLFGSFLLLRVGDATWFVSAVDDERQSLESTWRTDLPLGLPGDRVLIERDDSVWAWSADQGSGVPALGSSAAWWLPVKWRVPEGPTQARRAPAESTAALTGAPPPDSRPADSAAEGAPQAGAEESPGMGAAPAGDTGETGDEVPPGYYAVVGSSLSPGGIRSLAASLAEAGYETAVQRHLDEANETWYRALVGPYTTRAEAEEAGRRLRAERGLQAWVQEIETTALRSRE